MRTFTSLAALGLIAIVSACTTEGNDESGSDDSAVTTGWVTSEVTKRLRVENPSDEGKLWAVSTGNLLTDDSILQMPKEQFWGQSSVPAGHSDYILDEIHGVMTRAQNTLDITSLWAPSGKFLDTMRASLAELDRAGSHVSVRFLFGSYPGHETDARQTLVDLTSQMRNTTAMHVAVGIYSPGPTTWNHSKIIAADGREAIIGGMNLNASHYLGADPVHDMNLHVRGPATVTAQNYVNALWQDACGGGKYASIKVATCPTPFAMAASASAPVGNVRMIPVGRTGHSFHNPSDSAIVAMMDMAKNNGNIRISQQDIGSVKVFLGGVMPDAYLDAFTRAARRGVDINIVVSNDDSYGGGTHDKGDSYFNGWSLQDLWRGLIQRADQQWPDSHTQLCKHVHFQHLRAAATPTWASGMPYANHAKVVIVDDQAHYVGSQNLYDADLAEFGVIVDDQASTQRMLSEYWNHLEQFSVKTTYVDPECH
jgi:phosphatidylserine/phosphatidylglycerophosphate/cardiolipin synthase-like enzyme